MAKSKQSDDQDKANAVLLADAKFLLAALENGLPEGETPDEVADILELRIRQLEEMKPSVGRGALIIDLTNHLSEYQKQAAAAKANAEQKESVPAQAPDGKQVQFF